MIVASGVFFHKDYQITDLSEEDFRAVAADQDRTDIFRYEDGILYHAAIVKYGDEASIQSEVFRCLRIE